MKHTLEQLSAMSDRELDAVVATVVFGHDVKGVATCYRCEGDWSVDVDGAWQGSGYDAKHPVYLPPNSPLIHEGDPSLFGCNAYWLAVVPFYSSDWSAMGEVVGEMKAKGFRLVLDDFGNRFRVTFNGPVVFIKPFSDWRRNVEHKDAPRAVAIAAVLAVEATRE